MFLFTSRAPHETLAERRETTPFAEPLRRAAAATGVSFDYLARTAARESGFDPKARAGTSSAAGMFQFLDQTWLAMMRAEGARFGLAREAESISAERGRLTVGDPALRQRIMALREDPEIAATMAGAFAARNAEQLAQTLGRRPTEGELYIAHFLGAAGARDLIRLAEARPDAAAAAQFREAAAANRSVFFDRDGRARTAREVYNNLSAAFAAAPAAAPDTAATRDAAHQMFRLRGEGKPLHGLFRSSGAPVAEAVAEAWARMGRRPPVAEPASTRVAFFPGAAGQAAIASDAAAAAPIVETGRRRVEVEPPPRPAVPGPAERRAPPRAGKGPLDLMQFVKKDVAR